MNGVHPDVSLPQFEGPLDLLLELVRKDQLDIQDIPLGQVTRQYIDYLDRAELLDLELTSDFAYMASVLIQIKSRCLLAADPEIAARDGDPRRELVRMLLDHEQLRQGSEFLKHKLEMNEATWSRASIDDFGDPPLNDDPAQSGGTLNLLEVLRLAQQALSTARVFEVLAPADSVTVDQMVSWLERRLADSPRFTEAGPLFTEQATSDHRAALFLAILELTKAGGIRVEQKACFGPLFVQRAHPCLNVKRQEA